MSIARLAVFTLVAAGFLALPDGVLAQTPPAQTPPAAAQTPPPPPAPPAAPAPKSTDPFGEDVTLVAKTIVFTKGSANWDSAFETLVESFKKINDALAKQGVKPTGPAM